MTLMKPHDEREKTWEDVTMYLIDPLDGHSMRDIKEVVVLLKQEYGTSWAVGEVIDRILTLMMDSQASIGGTH